MPSIDIDIDDIMYGLCSYEKQQLVDELYEDGYCPKQLKGTLADTDSIQNITLADQFPCAENDKLFEEREKNVRELYEKIKTTWESMIYDAEFRDKYNYIDFRMFDNLNHSAIFLQLLSMYNLFSPVISLLTPLLLAIIPFFILKYQKIQIK